MAVPMGAGSLEHLAPDALEMAIWRRRRHDLTGLIHHRDRGGQTGFKRSSQHLPRRCDAQTKAKAIRSGAASPNALTMPPAGGTSRGAAALLGGYRQGLRSPVVAYPLSSARRSRCSVLPAAAYAQLPDTCIARQRRSRENCDGTSVHSGLERHKPRGSVRTVSPECLFEEAVRNRRTARRCA